MDYIEIMSHRLFVAFGDKEYFHSMASSDNKLILRVKDNKVGLTESSHINLYMMGMSDAIHELTGVTINISVELVK